MYDHQNGIAKGNPDYSALVKHGLEKPLHNIDFGGVRVIDRETRQKKREVCVHMDVFHFWFLFTFEMCICFDSHQSNL
jgi:hypothetical protein